MMYKYRTRIRPGRGIFRNELDVDASFRNGRGCAGWILWRDGRLLLHGSAWLPRQEGSFQCEIAALDFAVRAVLDDVSGQPLRIWNDFNTAGHWIKKMRRKKRRRGVGRSARRISMVCARVDARVELWAFSRKGMTEAHEIAYQKNRGQRYEPPDFPRVSPALRVERLTGKSGR